MLKYTLSPCKELTFTDLQIALLNYIIANQQESSFLIIVDDLTKEFIDGKEQEALDILKKFAINTEQKIHKKDNLSIYQRFAAKLIEDKKAYLCFCDNSNCNCSNLANKEIEKKLQDKISYSIVLKNQNNNIEIFDLLEGNISLDSKSDNFALINKNGNPTYEFSEAIDSMISGITTIVKDKNELPNSFKESLIHNLLNFSENIEYLHIDLDKDTPTLKELLQKGYLPDAIINYAISQIYLAPQEIFYLPDTIKWINVEKINKNRKKFEINELNEYNKKHILNMDSKKLSSIVNFADSDIGELLKLFLNDSNTINELIEKFKSIFSKKECCKDLKKLANIIQKAPIINDFSEFKEYVMNKSDLNKKDLNKALNLLLTGKEECDNLDKIYPFIKSYILEVARCQ